ncbi:ABC transporter substrate-binding protein [Wolbachia endosymbiont of Brugia malayi]|uniref:MlaC/ttg2D family ABC transporter substrate-binding protein n=1 Tax=Wolbachia endosymbiont of Brugia malayi TaxID=80849 RepID=UPI00004C93C4|nr:ABC transporter substrate-binding protein [Wolbachia endosymbiont of Brugia malayi]AAW71028.1 ABC-type transport system involved in resistance to organic solvents, auxiliary component [Wolbachia endosymbiont strain TRS of Brugia malayi]QCB61974.1 ABC transporter substrate-binding protein [Wolbachia endosymbiont of Brugia malayi]
MNVIKLLIIIVFIVISSRAYTNCADHKIFVHAMKQQVGNISTKENKKDREHVYKKLQEIIQNNIDLKKISRFVMGKHWTLTTQEEREDFLREYEIYFTRLCIEILYKYMNNSEMTIMSSRAVDNATCLISTRFFYSDEEFTNIDFKVTKNVSSFLISDVVMNGISISINQRSQFSEKIDAYSIARVIDELKYNNNL